MLAGTRAGAAADSNGSETTDTTAAEGAAVLRALSTAEGDGDDDDDEDERGGTGWQRRHQPRQGDDDDDDDAEWMQEGSFVCRDTVYSVGDCVLVNGDVAYTAEINGKTHHVQEKTDIWITKILAFQRPVSAHRSPPFAAPFTCVMIGFCENHKRKSQGKT